MSRTHAPRPQIRVESAQRTYPSARIAVVLAALVTCSAGTLPAQVITGKVQGRVTDASSGAAIAGAVVRVEGTTLANITNREGFYFINDVSPGLQDVRAEVLGYRPSVIETQRILAGQTTTLNFELQQAAIELEPLIVAGERNPLVPRDQVATKSIVQGETVDLLPVDNVSEIVVLQPGAYEVNCNDENELDGEFDGRCLSIRGGRPNEEALYVDGVLVRSFGTGSAQNLAVPTNALEQVDVTVGGFAAEFGEAQSGVVSYVTRTGGARFTGSVEVATDRLGPSAWTTNFNRLEANFGGPIAGPLTFFLAGSATGRSFFDDADGPSFWVQDHMDICPDAPQFEGLCAAGQPAEFTLPRASNTEGTADSVRIAAPGFTEWDSRIIPWNWEDNYLFTGNVNWQLPRGSRVTFGYTRNRFQWYGRGAGGSAYRSDNMDGSRDSRDMFTLGSFLTLAQSATQQIALDVRLSYAEDHLREGVVDPDWYLDHAWPSFGFSLSDVDFLFGDEELVRQGLKLLRPGELELQAARSGAIFRDSTAIYPGRWYLSATQTLTGLSENLRANPYGYYTGYFIGGPANAGYQQRTEKRWQLRASLDWQLGRFNRLKVGGELIDVSLNRSDIWLFQSRASINLTDPRRLAAFVQDRLDVGDLVLEAGVRLDYLEPNIEYERVPGFWADEVPDSLKAGYIVWNPNTQTYDPLFDEPCGGVTAQNPNGTCLENFLPASNKTEWSPRLGASFPVTPTSTFRLSYGRFVQTPAFYSASAMITGGVAAGQAGLWDAGRDTELPSTRTFEFGYRQLIGQDFVIDLSAFNKKQRQALTYRSLPYEDPNNQGFIVYQDVLTNLDFTESNGFELKLDKAVSSLGVANLSYTYLDAKGTGWDPLTYLALTGRRSSNLAFQTGEPVDAPEVLLPSETARQHNLAFTGSVQFPRDYREGSVAGAVLRNLGLFAVFSARSGQRFTKLEQFGRASLAPPTGGSDPESSFGAIEMPWQYELDLRLSKGFHLGRGLNLQAFVDWRNPFGIRRTNVVFAETGDISHEAAREQWIVNALEDVRLDGDGVIRDFDIAAESPENDFNKYMLMRAEQRWGNGDGVFTVEEQEASFGEDWEFNRGQYTLAPSNQSLRLGMRVAF